MANFTHGVGDRYEYNVTILRVAAHATLRIDLMIGRYYSSAISLSLLYLKGSSII